jgi:DNA-binding MarR family transcriptional regulator
MSSLELGDPLAHRALQALLRAEATVRKRLAIELEREGVTAAGFSVLVVLTTAGGSLELKTLRRRLGWSKATRGFVSRRRAPEDRRVVVVDLAPTGRSLVERLFPAHSERVQAAFDALDEGEKRTFSELCRKLAA